ncbi:hypothetical protein OROHE_026173 [Orobanche hederae]
MGTGFAVRCCSGNDCYDHKHFLSFLSPEDLSVSENIDIPFDNNDKYEVISRGASYGEWLYFYSNKGQFAFYNIKSKDWIVVPPTEILHPLLLEGLFTSGLGYDAKSGEFKLIKIYRRRNFVGEAAKAEEEGLVTYDPIHEECFELYSLDRGSRKKIVKPTFDCCTHINVCVYVDKTCYWTASVRFSYDHDIDKQAPENMFSHVLSFDFTTESFDQFPLPVTNTIYTRYQLVECGGGLLGVLVYWRPHEQEKFSSSYSESDLLSIRLYVLKGKGRVWCMLYDVSLDDVERPLGLKDDHLLFLEAKPIGERSQLVVYDLDTKMLRELNIYNCPKHMSVISYAETSVQSIEQMTSEEEKEKEKAKAKKREKKKKKKKEKAKAKKKGNHISGDIIDESLQQQ